MRLRERIVRSHDRACSDRRLFLGACASLVLLGRVPWAIAQTQRFRTLTLNAAGRWQTEIRNPDGTSEVFEVEAANRFIATVDSFPSVVNAASGRASYSYLVRNDPASIQGIDALIVSAGRPERPFLTPTSYPTGWNRSGFFTSDSPLMPGTSGEFAGEADGYPGVVPMDMIGTTDRNWVLPDGLSDQQMSEILIVRDLRVRHTVVGPLIGKVASIPVRDAYARLLEHFHQEFRSAAHPRVDALDSLSRRLGVDMQSPDGLGKKLEDAAQVGSDWSPWHRALSGALSVCGEIIDAQLAARRG